MNHGRDRIFLPRIGVEGGFKGLHSKVENHRIVKQVLVERFITEIPLRPRTTTTNSHGHTLSHPGYLQVLHFDMHAVFSESHGDNFLDEQRVQGERQACKISA